MSTSPSGISNWNKMNDKDRAYLVKLLGTIFSGIITGLITGPRAGPLAANEINGISNGWLGLIILLVTSVGLSYLIKFQFKLGEDMTDVQILRVGSLIGPLSFLFFWIVTFNFIIF